MKNIFVSGLISLLLLGSLAAAADSSTTASGESRWVLGAGTVLKSEAAVTSADILPLKVGDKVTVLESSGRWLKVETPAKETGWVFAGRLSTTAPVAEVAASDDIFAASAQQSQIEIAQADSARSVRGLSAETASYAKERGTPQEYRQALDQILARRVSKEELTVFMRDGKLGEYAQ